MSETTKAAMNAAEAHFGHKVCKPNASEYVFVERLAKTIDRETGLPELVAALREIAEYGKHHGGCCPYGCDTPSVAIEALRKAGEL